MKTLKILATCVSISVLLSGIGKLVKAQDDLPPRPRIDVISPSSVPAFEASESKSKASAPIKSAAKQIKSKPSVKRSNSSSSTKKKFDLSFEDLKFEMEKGDDFDRSMLTEKINSYHGNIISIRGFIRPANKQSGLTKFIFVRDNKECCFGPGAALYDCVLVRLKKGLDTDYTVRPVTIEGKFALKEYRVDGKAWSIYRMTDTKVK
jgi:hypothetical protein